MGAIMRARRINLVLIEIVLLMTLHGATRAASTAARPHAASPEGTREGPVPALGTAAAAEAAAAEVLWTPGESGFALDVDGMRRRLAGAPREGTDAAAASPLIVAVPLPDGSLRDYAVAES